MMTTQKKSMAALAAAFGLLWAGCLSAGEITCSPDNQRVATLGDAVECKTLNSVNLNSPAQIDALFDDLGDPGSRKVNSPGPVQTTCLRLQPIRGASTSTASGSSTIRSGPCTRAQSSPCTWGREAVTRMPSPG